LLLLRLRGLLLLCWLRLCWLLPRSQSGRACDEQHQHGGRRV
jgi:hypothetical protein